jgi:hypothetical protein
MPHLDRRSNIKEAYKPNIYDYCCVNEFYSLLDNLTKKIFTVINNWVNFLHPRPYWPKGVEMFSAIVKIVIKNKILLTSWSNNDLVYDIRNIDPSLKKDKFKQEFIYINPNTLSQHKSNISNYPLFIISDILCHNKKNNIDLFQFAF